MSNKKLIKELKGLAKQVLETNERFHDYAHAVSVFNNAKKIIIGEKAEKKVNSLVVYTAALFHDVSNVEKNDSLESSKMIPELLNSVNDFPLDLIKEVQRVIKSIDTGKMNKASLDEIIINEADSLEALSKLSICRGCMICAKRDMKLKVALLDIDNLVTRKHKEIHKKIHTKTAKKIADKEVKFIKEFIKDCLRLYEY